MVKINKLSLMNQFVFFDNFVEECKFHSYLRASDIIMPLIHKSHSYFKEINGEKISGTFNLAFAHKKPILCEDCFDKFGDFQENGIFYKLENMIKIINGLSSDNSILINKASDMYRNPKWSFEFQRNKYIEFIEKG
jgi:hypothetical protein